MNYLRSLLTCIALCFLLVVSACQNDDGDDNRFEPEQITGQWKFVKTIIDGSETPLDDCERDDELHLLDQGAVRILNGSNRCDPQIGDLSGTWTLNETARTLTVSTNFQGTVLDHEMSVIELTSTTLRLGFIGETPTGDNAAIEETYTK